jgi:hypothetical protein
MFVFIKTHCQYGFLLNLFAYIVPPQGLSSSQYPYLAGVAQAFAIKEYIIRIYNPHLQRNNSIILV